MMRQLSRYGTRSRAVRLCGAVAAGAMATALMAASVAPRPARAAPATVRLNAVFSSAQSGSQSFLRFDNTGAAAGTVTLILRNAATGQSFGQWTSPDIPPNSEQQYGIARIESDLGISGAARPAYYTVALQAGISGYLQHVLYRPADGTLTNLSTCDSGVTSAPTRLMAVHTPLLEAGFPSTVVVNNIGGSASAVTLGIYNADTGVRLGTYTTASIAPGAQLLLSMTSLATAAGVPASQTLYHFVVKAETAFTGYLQHLVTNKSAGVITDMTTSCALDGAAGAAAASPLRLGAVYSSSQAASQSFLRVHNTDRYSGAVALTLRDYATGSALGTWTSPVVPAGAEQQFFIGTIEAQTGQSLSKPSYYSVSVQSDINGAMQHVLYRPADGTLTNLSTCAAGVTADPARLAAVHSSLLDDGYPSAVVIANTGGSGASAVLAIYDAETGVKLGTYTSATLQPGTQVVVGMTDIATAAGITPNATRYHYVVLVENSFTGTLQHLVTNQRAGVISDMTTVCTLKPTLATFEIQSFQHYATNAYASGASSPTAGDLQKIAALYQDYKDLGANTVTIGWGVPVNQVTGALGTSFNNIPSQHAGTLAEIRQLIDTAKSVGLKVILKPQAQTQSGDPNNGNLSNNIYPDSVNANFDAHAFLANWAGYIGQVAQLAQDTGAIGIGVGTENHTYDQAPYRSDWIAVINAARARYSGLISYHSFSEPYRVAFWDQVDIIGIDAYYNLTSNLNPTYADVLAGWTANTATYSNQSPNGTAAPINIPAELKKLSDQYGKSLYFAEAGGRSFHGVVNSPSGAGPSGATADQQQHAWLFQSLFQAMNAANSTNWFRGVNIWGAYNGQPAKSDPGFASYTAQYTTDFEIRGKQAALITASWYGGMNYFGDADTSFTGSLADDRISLYGSALNSAQRAYGNTQINQGSTYPTTVSFTLGGNLLNNVAPTIHVYINGVDKGATTMNAAPGTYVDQNGIRWTNSQTFTYTLAGLVDVTQLRIAIDNPVRQGNVATQTFLNAASINGVALSGVSYANSFGGTESQTVNTNSGTYNGGAQTLNTAPWTTALAARRVGTAGQQIRVNGGEGGTDTVYVLGRPSNYTITGIGTGTVTLGESSGLNQNAVLTSIERVVFQNGDQLNTSTGQIN